jgi:lipoate-protein ligase A
MQLIEYDSSDPRDYLAADELLLAEAEEGRMAESLRFAEIETPAVIMGVSARWAEEANRERCRAAGVPVLRRCSGGGTVLIGRGCLNYSLILDIARDPALGSIHGSYRWIVPRIAEALSAFGPRIVHAGLSDLAWGARKVGGSSQKRRMRCILHHGTLLYDAYDVSVMDELLPCPSRAPDYRAGRSHADFLTTLPLTSAQLRMAVRRAFAIPPDAAPLDLTAEMSPRVADFVATKYGTREWTFRR